MRVASDAAAEFRRPAGHKKITAILPLPIRCMLYGFISSRKRRHAERPAVIRVRRRVEEELSVLEVECRRGVPSLQRAHAAGHHARLHTHGLARVRTRGEPAEELDGLGLAWFGLGVRVRV